MQNLTLSPKSRPVWASWRVLLPLLTLLVGLGSSHPALAQNPSFFDDAITITKQPTGIAMSDSSYAGTKSDSPYTSYLPLGTTSSTPARSNKNIGTYDINTPRTSQLVFTGGSIVARPAYDPDIPGFVGTISAARILYSVYAKGATTPPKYSVLVLNDAGIFSGTKRLYNNTASVDLLSNILGSGLYVVDVQFQVDVTNNGTTNTYLDPSSSYQAEFTVTAPAVTPAGGTTTWLSTTNAPFNGSTDWTLASNWSNGVPNATSNAVIPDKTNNSKFVYPVLDSRIAVYEVNNLTLLGNSNSTRALIDIGVATLTIYGDLDQTAGGLTGSSINSIGVADPDKNSTIIFAGSNQVITGRLAVSDIVIAGSGIKSVINTLNPNNILLFKPKSVTDGVIVQSAARQNGTLQTTYVFDTTYNSLIDLGSRGAISTVDGEGETNVSYVRGVSRSLRNLNTIGQKESFGNIGIDLISNHTVTSGITIFRVVGDALNGPTGSSAVPIKRQYQIIGDNDSNAASFSDSKVNVIFHYLPSSDELNGIAEGNLAMFSTTTGGEPYTPLGGEVDVVTHTVSRLAVPSLNPYTLTLGDKTNPLPVVLVSFNATRSNTNALLTWKTATETNSKGFEVQVSTDGTAFRMLGFVSSETPNSIQAKNYKYTDTESGKFGTRYYRLHQVDLDGKDSYSPTRAVSFDGTATGAVALSVYPNPFLDTDKVSLNFGSDVANGVAQVQLIDMVGRTVRQQSLAINNSSLDLGDLSDLHTGMYLARITLADGSTQSVRLQKK